MATRREFPFVYPTWLSGLLSGEDQCRWAAWFKAHFQYEKRPCTDGHLAQWKADHNAMVRARADRLIADGHTVFLEKQNKFWLRGKAATLMGTPDLVAIRGDNDALVVDCKSGRPYDKHVWQVCVYLLALPLKHAACKDRRLTGEVQYADHSVLIAPDAFTLHMREQITSLILEVAGLTPPARVPSPDECRYCDIPGSECPARMEEADDEAAAEVTHDLF
jgi:hypothetical protein